MREMTDAEVFGPQKEMSDAQVFGNPSMGDKFLRQLGLTARAGGQGLGDILSLPGTVMDAITSVIDATGALPEKLPKFHSSEAVGNLLTKAGLPEPETKTERVVQNVAGAMVGAGGQAKAANEIAKAGTGLVRPVAEKFAESPGLQIASGATGAGAGSVARESGAGPGVQLAATLLGGAVPSVSQATGSAALRGLLRGGEEGRLKTAGNLDTFSGAGTTPTVGQATESRSSRLAETMLGKTPGSAGVMANKATGQAQEIGGKVGELADSLTLRSGSAPAGRAIKQGIEGGFVQDFRAKQQQLYDKLDQYIPPETQIPASNVLSKLQEINKPISGAEQTSAILKTPKIGSIGSALSQDVAAKPAQPILSKLLGPDGKPIVTGQTLEQPGGIPYQAIKELRTAIGSKITNPSLTDDIPTAQWKQLYGALSEDMKSAATQAGPEAEKAFNQANAYTKAGHSRIENVLQPVLAKADPEDIFRAATSGMQEGATTIQGVMKSLPDKAQRSVAATVLNRLGVAQAGKQDASGELFSPETFLTNWNKMTPDSKTALFSRYGLDFTKNLDQVAEVASNLRTGNKIFSNPSGTEAALTSKLGVAGIIYGTLFGHPGTAAALAGGMGGAHLGAKYLMTNPAFVGWLAQTTTVPKGTLPAQINLLEQISAKQPKEQGDAMRGFAESLKSAQGQMQ